MKNCYREVRLDSGHLIASVFIKQFFDHCSKARFYYLEGDFSLRDIELNLILNSIVSIHALYLVGAISETLFNWLDRYKDETYDFCCFL